MKQQTKKAYRPSLKCEVEYYVKNGETEFVAHNKVVGQGLRHLVNALHYYCLAGGGNISISTGLGTVRVGTGSGATADGTTGLVAEVATAPSSVAYSTDNPVAGQYRAKMTATWNAGVLSAVTVTEIAAKGGCLATLQSLTHTTNVLLGRLSVTDGEFASFLVNTAVPLVIEIRFTFTFA